MIAIIRRLLVALGALAVLGLLAAVPLVLRIREHGISARAGAWEALALTSENDFGTLYRGGSARAFAVAVPAVSLVTESLSP